MTWLLLAAKVLVALVVPGGILGVIWYLVRGQTTATDRAQANAKAAEKYRNEADLYSAPARDLAAIVSRMRERDDA